MTRSLRFAVIGRLPPRRHRGFSALELMIALAVLAIISGFVISANIRDWRREQVNTVVIELAGWLETVRRSALKGTSCRVTIAAGTYRNGDAAPLGQLSPDPCGTVQPFRLTGIAGNQAIRVVTSRSVTFTPAGTLTPPPAADAPIVIRLQLQDDPDPERCLQLDGLLGVIDVGHSEGSGPCVIDQGI